MNKINKRNFIVSSALALACFAGPTQAATWDVSVFNLTNGNHFTPLLLTAHDHDTHLFEVGSAASLPIEHMAECGHLDPLLATTEVGAEDADTIANPAGGFLAPGASVTTSLTTTETHLSLVAMVLPTNDAFVGLDSLHVPTDAGTYTYYLNAYDAGTEGNDEVLSTSGTCSYTDTGTMPGAPGGDADSNATGVVTPGSDDNNSNIHIHRGVLGDATATGTGDSDLVSTIHRWQNPVAKIVITVTP